MPEPSSSIGVALLGCGIVGSGVVKLLQQEARGIADRSGVRFDLRHVVVRSVGRARLIDTTLPLTTDASAAIADPSVLIVVELIGGIEPALTLARQVLSLGKRLVTANKALLSRHGAELFALARKHDTVIAFEASCGGGIPIIDALQRGLLANRIDALLGIVNGTCNFILTQMTSVGMGYDEALKQAQSLGFAEADPTADVGGHDAAQKLTLLASLAFARRLEESDISVQGIDKLDAVDIHFARELGYVIKLLAVAQQTGSGEIALSVQPTLVPQRHVLADVAGSFNAISVYGHALGHSLFYGRGAGQMPTASAVVSDMLAVAIGTAKRTFDALQILPDRAPRAKVARADDLQSRFYLRVRCEDRPGVMAAITHCLGEAGISLSAVLQPEVVEEETDLVPIVITTHRARAGDLRSAIARIETLPSVQGRVTALQILQEPVEAIA